jgi:hypothetical protein
MHGMDDMGGAGGMGDGRKAARIAALREVLELLEGEEVESLRPQTAPEMPMGEEMPPEEGEEGMSPEDEELLRQKLAGMG